MRKTKSVLTVLINVFLSGVSEVRNLKEIMLRQTVVAEGKGLKIQGHKVFEGLMNELGKIMTANKA